MAKDKRRQATWFKINAERWMTSSTRIELKVEERAVWVDVLAMAALNGGIIEAPAISSSKGGRPQPNFSLFASNMMLPLSLVEHCFNLFLTYGKLSLIYDKPERKFYYKVAKWEQYQDSFLWGNGEKKPLKKPPRKNKKDDDNETDKRRGVKRKGEREEKEKRRV